MPLQNRVDPYGTLFRTTARGTFMGNRGGAIHNEHREIVRPFLNRRWITCVLEFRGRRRTVMTPRRYTELFFLDEAVAFAAGHRPCAECRRDRFNAFREAWAQWDRRPPPGPLRADYIDETLHAARVDRGKHQVTHRSAIDDLPEGTFIDLDRAPWLVLIDAIAQWTPEGYTAKRPRPSAAVVTVLTPAPFVQCFRAGYTPVIHQSAGIAKIGAQDRN